MYLYHQLLAIRLQTVNESPIKYIEEDKHHWEQKARSFVYPCSDLLWGHLCPCVVFRRLVGALAVVVPRLPPARHQLVVALSSDRRQVEGGWETLLIL